MSNAIRTIVSLAGLFLLGMFCLLLVTWATGPASAQDANERCVQNFRDGHAKGMSGTSRDTTYWLGSMQWKALDAKRGPLQDAYKTWMETSPRPEKSDDVKDYERLLELDAHNMHYQGNELYRAWEIRNGVGNGWFAEGPNSCVLYVDDDGSEVLGTRIKRHVDPDMEGKMMMDAPPASLTEHPQSIVDLALDDAARIRSGPGVEHSVVGLCPGRHGLTVWRPAEGDWLRASCYGANGYIHSSLVDVAPPVERAPSMMTKAEAPAMEMKQTGAQPQVQAQPQISYAGLTCDEIWARYRDANFHQGKNGYSGRDGDGDGTYCDR